MTNGVSKKVESLTHAVSLPAPPAIAAAVASHVGWVWGIAGLLD
jgi:hypothetical protein